MRVGRVAMAVDVLVEGWGGASGKGWVEGEWDRVVGIGEFILRIAEARIFWEMPESEIKVECVGGAV